MGVGAIGNEVGYYGYGAVGRNNRTNEENMFSALGSATSETTSSSNGKTIGIMTVGDIGYLAKYADSSTPADPIIKVGNYEVKINEVDPNNATQLEMFAWTSYMEDAGLIEKHGMSSYSKMKAYAVQSQYDGVCSGIYDGGSNTQDFWGKKQNWSAIISNAKNIFANMPDTYSQSLECGKLLSYFDKWNAEVSKRTNQTDYHQMLLEHMDQLHEKIKNGETEQEFQIGGQSMTVKEWDKLLSRFDTAEEALREIEKEDAERVEESSDFIKDKTVVLTARYTTYKSQGSYIDPNKPDTTVQTGYIGRVFYTSEGIVYHRSGYNSKEGTVKDTSEWVIKYDSDDDYERIMNFLDKIPEDDNLIFTTRQSFWEDFVSGKIDEDSFLEYYQTLDHGTANFIKTDENGKTYLDKEMVNSEYFQYFGLQQIKTVPYEDLQRGLEESAARDKGYIHSQEDTTPSIYDALYEAFSEMEKSTYQFYGEEKTYSLDEWLQEIIQRAHIGLMDELFGGTVASK